MRFGICQWNLPVNGPEGCYELVKLGLDGMELSYTDELINNIDRYRMAAEETGMLFPTIGMNNFCDNSYIVPETEEYFETHIAKALECAAGLGVKTIQIPAFGVSDIKNEAELEMAAKNLNKACEMAVPYGIVIGTENALTLEQNQKLFSMVNHPLLKFYFDNQNLYRMKGIPCKDVILGMKERIVEAHAKDSLMMDGVQTWVPLGTGDGEFTSSMKLLNDFGYDGWVHLENDYQLDAMNRPESFDYEEAIKRDIATLKACH